MAWNRNDTATPKKAVKGGGLSPAVKGIVAGAVVIVGALVAFFVISGGEKKPAKAVKEKKPTAIAEVKPAAAPKSDDDPRTKGVEAAMANLKQMPKTEIPRRELSPEEWNRITNRVFKTGTEQLLSWVCHVTPGDMPMPIPNLSDEDKKNLAAILISKNPVKEDDTEQIANLKQDVDFAKKEMAQYIKEGGDPDEFLQYYFKELNRCFEYRNEALRQLHEVYEQENAALAKDFCQRLNERLRGEGIREIDYKEEFDEEDESPLEESPTNSNQGQGEQK